MNKQGLLNLKDVLVRIMPGNWLKIRLIKSDYIGWWHCMDVEDRQGDKKITLQLEGYEGFRNPPELLVFFTDKIDEVSDVVIEDYARSDVEFRNWYL